MLDKVSAVLEQFRINALLLIGGFEAYNSCLILVAGNRDKYSALRIPITSLSLGSDTAVNEICQLIDKIKQSATGTNDECSSSRPWGVLRLFGYYFCLSLRSRQCLYFRGEIWSRRHQAGRGCNRPKDAVRSQRYLVVRAEKANKNYTTSFVNNCSVRRVKESSPPESMYLAMPSKAARAVEYLVTQIRGYIDVDNNENKPPPRTASLLGLSGRRVCFTPVEELPRRQTLNIAFQ
uniref:Phosphofructokinase domain-containing protein n=1 Tax=Ditylenchus dipsaci TaxID=166011 RepID=A0A915ENM9_9BILA